MAYELNGTNQYFNTATTPVNTLPATISCWFNPDLDTANQILVNITNNNDASAGTRFGLIISGATAGDPIQAYAQSGSTVANATSTTPFTANAWNHACGVFTSTTSRTVYLNGGGSATNTDLRNTTGIDRIRIGARFSSGTPGLFFDGKLAEIGIWNAALTAAEIASLAKGMTCDKVRPQSLVFYAPLIRDLIDAKGGLTITNNNSATIAGQPRVYA